MAGRGVSTGGSGNNIPEDRAAWEDDMLHRLLCLQQPLMKPQMVNFVVDDDVSDRLLAYVIAPQESTDVSRRPLGSLTEKESAHAEERDPTRSLANAAAMAVTLPSSAASAVMMSYRATHFLTGGFDAPLEKLPGRVQSALAHFYSEKAPQILSGIFEAIADRPIRVNVHHIHRLWEACVYFGRPATLDFFDMPGEALGLCLGALLDLARHGIMGSMFRDVVQLFSLQPVFSGSALMAQRISALAESVGESRLFLRLMEVACEGQRPQVEVAAVADLHSQLMFGMARCEAQRPVLASFGQDAAEAVQMYTDLLDRFSDTLEALSERPSGGGGSDGDDADDETLLAAAVQAASDVLATTLDCCGRETLDSETEDFGELPTAETNFFREQRGPVFAAGAAAVPAICRFAKAVVAQQLSLRLAQAGAKSLPNNPSEITSFACRYTVSLDGALSVLVHLMQDDPAGTAGALVDEGMCSALCDWFFLFPRSSLFQCQFKKIFALAVINGSHLGFCESMLGPALLLQRMVHFAESVDGRSESESGANHLQHRGLLALVIACLNILRLKAAEIRSAVDNEDNLPELLISPDTPGAESLSGWLPSYLDSNDNWTRFLPRLLELTRAQRPSPAGASCNDDSARAPQDSDGAPGTPGRAPNPTLASNHDDVDLFSTGLLLSDFESEVDRMERESIDLGSDYARELGFRAS